MHPALGFTQAAGTTPWSGLLKAREALRAVKIEVSVGYYGLETEKRLNLLELVGRVAYKVLPVDKVHLGEREVVEPSRKVFAVQADFDGAPRGLYKPGRRMIAERELLERLDDELSLFADGLGVV